MLLLLHHNLLREFQAGLLGGELTADDPDAIAGCRHIDSKAYAVFPGFDGRRHGYLGKIWLRVER